MTLRFRSPISGLHVRAEVDRDAVREAPVAAHRDAEALADRAVGAVGRDQVLRADRRARRRSRGRGSSRSRRRRPPRTRRPRTSSGWRRPAPPPCARRIGSSPICVTNSRGEGLRCSTPSLTWRKNHSTSFPPRLSTDMTAPFCSNSRPGGGDDLVLEADASPQLDRALEEQRGARVDRRPGMPLYDDRRDPRCRQGRAAVESPTRLPPTTRTRTSLVRHARSSSIRGLAGSPAVFGLTACGSEVNSLNDRRTAVPDLARHGLGRRVSRRERPGDVRLEPCGDSDSRLDLNPRPCVQTMRRATSVLRAESIRTNGPKMTLPGGRDTSPSKQHTDCIAPRRSPVRVRLAPPHDQAVSAASTGGENRRLASRRSVR